MLSLNINETRTLNFKIQLEGISPKQLYGFLRFELNGVEYGFPAKFKNESIDVDIPILKNIIVKEIKEGDIIPAKLEVDANGHFLKPWSGEFTVLNPIKMEAELENIDEIVKIPKIKVNKVLTEKGVKKKKVKKLTSEDKIINENIDSKLGELYSTKKVPVKKINKKLLLDNITKEQIFEYMRYMGTKNPTIQKIIYEQASLNAKSSNLKDIFKKIYTTLKK